ncbi:MAG: hypothetical protein IJD57_03100 [Candidatus Gastranaerophilales bacterium]|nr:hypothetical protein [Candidatus Gastranaerophilales bacterium]
MSDITTSQGYFAKLNASLENDVTLNEIYKMAKSAQQSEIKELFQKVNDNNATEDDKKALEARKTILESKVKQLEAKMAALEEELAAKEPKVKQQAKLITALVESAESLSETLKDDQKKFMEDAYADVMYEYKAGLIGKNEIFPELTKRLANSGLSGTASKIENIALALNSKRAELQPLIDETCSIVDQVTALENQYGATKSIYNLLNANIEQIGNYSTSYANIDTSSIKPVYSLAKTEIVSGFFEDLTTQPTNTALGKTTAEQEKEPVQYKTIDEINTKFSQYYDANTQTDAVKSNLTNAVNNGLLDDLKASNLSTEEIINFFSTNFKSSNIKMSGSKLDIPNGIGGGMNSTTQKTYSKIATFFNNLTTANTVQEKVYTLNTTDNIGNTISTNAQMATLNSNYENILDSIGNREPKFTFKEAMYFMFDSENGLFKNCGISYDYQDQEAGAKYSIAQPGDAQTEEFYNKLSDKIFEIWGVRANQTPVSTESTTQDIPERQPTPTIKRSDPITFTQDNKEFAFVIDRDNDGEMSGKNEFVGATGDWVKDLKTFDKDGNNILEGDELKEVTLLTSEYKDNAQVKNDRKVDGKNFLSEETTNITYGITNAQTLGIDKIDLNDLESNKSTGKYDINGSEIFEDKVTFKMNGVEITAKRKDDTDEYMNTVYANAYGKNLSVGFSDDQIQNIMDKSYGEFSQMFSSYSDVIGNINIIRGTDKLAQDTRDLFNETTDSLDDEKKAYLRRANNTATAQDANAKWEQIQGQVKSKAMARGIDIDMTQAKGIFLLTDANTAEEVLKEYNKMIENEDMIAKNQESISIAWEAIVLCVREGILVPVSDILEALNNGHADNAKDVVQYLKEQVDEKNPKKYKYDRMQSSENVELNLDDKRTKEILSSFEKAFKKAGKEGQVLNALYKLCVEQQVDRDFMSGKSGDNLAQEILNKYYK